MIYFLIAIGWSPGGSSTEHIYTQTVHRKTQLTTSVGRLSGIRTQSGQTKINVKIILLLCSLFLIQGCTSVLTDYQLV